MRSVNNTKAYSLTLTPHSVRGFSAVVLLWIVTLLMFAGCDFRRVVVNHPIDPQSLQTLSSGESSIQDVVQALGAPDEIAAKPGGMVLRYRYGDSKTMRINFGWILRFFLPVAPSMNLGRGDEVPQVLQIAMNRDGTFDQYLLSQPLEPQEFSFWPF